MKKIGVFGGSFNPVHNGHINLAQCYLDTLKLDSIMFVPTALPPHKTAQYLASKEDRLAMLSLATQDNNAFVINDLEFNRQGKSYTYDTLIQLKNDYPNCEFYLIIGADQFLYFKKWYNYKEILNMATVCTAARENDELDKLVQFKNADNAFANSIISVFPVIEVSSTQIRDMIKSNKDASNFVPKNVLNYIKEHKLYV
jgi:nicotinate-nucleotide adenylyltransferase